MDIFDSTLVVFIVADVAVVIVELPKYAFAL